MKKLNILNRTAWLPVFFCLLLPAFALAQEDSTAAPEAEAPEAPEQVVKLHYYNQANSIQYLVLESLLKTGKKTEPLPGKAFKIYLDSASQENLVSQVKTNAYGKAKAVLPVALQTTWNNNATHRFLVVSEPTGKEEETTNEFEITKAKISIDTLNEDGVRSIQITVQKNENGEWVPANEVEMKVGVSRLGGVLSGGDEDTYTTDSTGMVTVEFTKKELPGNAKGEIILVAKVDENEYYGNLRIEKPVPWGVATTVDKTFFDHRTLWSTANRAPWWLLLIASAIILGVWGALVYIFILLIRIRKQGAGKKVTAT